MSSWSGNGELNAAPKDNPEKPGWWPTLRAALRGDAHDLTTGSINQALVRLVIPMVVEMAMESMFDVVDVFWVSLLGGDAVAIAGITASLLAIAFAVALGLAAAGGAVVARRIGEKDAEGASLAAGQIILLGGVASTLMAIGGVLFADRLLALMDTPESAVAVGTSYATISLGSSALIILLVTINGVFRGAGEAARAMRVLWLSNLLNAVLVPCFVFGLGPLPELGLSGAAMATALGRGFGVAMQVYFLIRGRRGLVLGLRHFVPEPKLLSTLFRLAVSGTLQMMISTVSWLVLVRLLAAYGSPALAGYTIAMRVVGFATLPLWGLANAAATMVGQNLGAGRPERAEAAVYRAGLWSTALLTAIGLAFMALAAHIVGLFTEDPLVLSHGVQALRVVTLGFLFYGFGTVFNQALNGAGYALLPMLLNIACFWFFELPLAWFLADRLQLGPLGVYASISITFFVLTVLSAIVFHRGAWKRQVL